MIVSASLAVNIIINLINPYSASQYVVHCLVDK